MKRSNFILAIVATLFGAFAIYWVVTSEHALVTHPKGIIAKSILNLITTNILLMLVIIIPTFILLLLIAWKYRVQNTKKEFNPEHSYGVLGEVILWTIPSVIVVVMSVITWNATHELDPYKPIKSERKPLTIQVVALDWKWLFIYPEQGIATVNFVQFPAGIPIRFSLSADHSPMNSFWIPSLSGQIYAMTGMATTLYMMADGPGIYKGRAAEINGEGYADMTFVAQSTTESDFDDWVDYVKQSPLHLTDPIYNELVKRSRNNPITLYSSVEKNLFDKVLMKPMHPQTAP